MRDNVRRKQKRAAGVEEVRGVTDIAGSMGNDVIFDYGNT